MKIIQGKLSIDNAAKPDNSSKIKRLLAASEKSNNA